MNTFAAIPLENAEQMERYGAKAVNLARLLNSGIQTASGFVLGVEFLAAHLSKLGLAQRVEALFSALESGKTGDHKAEAAVIRRHLLESRLDPALMNILDTRVDTNVVYAVRSSAPCEDGEEASFAGQFESVLNCRSLDAVAEAIRQVWASLFGDRAVQYAFQHRCRPLGMAVLVQNQIEAAVSGVMFTRDPRNPAGRDILVEYCPGLGEQLVSGQLTPGRMVIRCGEGDVLREQFPETSVALDPASTEISWLLRQVADKLETLFAAPQDVEWSLDKAGKLHVLQARPITASSPSLTEVIWTNANIAENFPDPVCPLLRSFVGRGYSAYFRSLGKAFGISTRKMAIMAEALDNLVGCHAGRLYYNLTNIHAVLHLAPGGRWLAQYFNQFTGAQSFPSVKRVAQGALAEVLEVVSAALRVFWRYFHIEKSLEAFERAVNTYAAASSPDGLSEKSPEQLATLLRGFLEIRLERWTGAALADTAAMVCYGVLRRLLRGEANVDANDLLKGLPDLASAKPVERLWDLSRELRANPALYALFSEASAEEILGRLRGGHFPAFHAALNSYFDTWGFRSSGELMLSRSTPREDPLPLLRLLKSYAAQEGPGPAEVSRCQAEARRRSTRQVRRQLGLWHGAAFALVLWAAQGSIRRRERARMKQALLYTRLRHVALAVGNCLVEQGLLEHRHDVFYLTIDETIALAEGADQSANDIVRQIAERKADLEACMALHPPDSFALPKGEVWLDTLTNAVGKTSVSSEALSGAGACGGLACGHAAVVLDVAEIDRIQPDQILITRQTDPGWAAVFFMIKGLVIERGGLLSHGAIIAREYGIPAVVGVRDATRLIEDGQVVRVDGYRGRVEYVR